LGIGKSLCRQQVSILAKDRCLESATTAFAAGRVLKHDPSVRRFLQRREAELTA